MKKINNLKILLVVILLLSGCSIDRHGVIGATFRLDKNSNLPAWFVNTTNYPNNELSVEIIRYEPSTSDKWKTKIIIYNPNKGKIQEKAGLGYWHPESEQTNKFPKWIIIEIDNTKEVYEQSKMNDILKIVDKPI